MSRDLSDVDRAVARSLWRGGWTLGEIANHLGCSVYDLSPWLYMEMETTNA